MIFTSNIKLIAVVLFLITIIVLVIIIPYILKFFAPIQTSNLSFLITADSSMKIINNEEFKNQIIDNILKLDKSLNSEDITIKITEIKPEFYVSESTYKVDIIINKNFQNIQNTNDIITSQITSNFKITNVIVTNDLSTTQSDTITQSPTTTQLPTITQSPTPCESDIGSYCSNNSILECPPGTYCTEKNMTEPKKCPAGYYCPDSSSEPIICQPGSYCPEMCVRENFTVNTQNCRNLPLACPAGTYSRTTGASQCTLCPAGKTSSIGAISCT